MLPAAECPLQRVPLQRVSLAAGCPFMLDSHGGEPRMRHTGLLVALVLAVGIAGTVVALKSRESNAEFVSQQQALQSVDATQLEKLILTTADPRPGYSGRARGARCVSATRSALGNPWSCVVRYPQLPRVRYGVTVYANRSISGSGQPEGRPLHGLLTVRGCCVASGAGP
jgi:hypothetical protein